MPVAIPQVGTWSAARRVRGRRVLLRCAVLGVAGLVALSAGRAGAEQRRAKSAVTPAAPPVAVTVPISLELEPRAIEILKAASATLAAARTMRFTAIVSYENPSLLGPPLVYTTRSDVTLQRPNKLRVITSGDGPPSEFYDDGTQLIALAPAENLVAIAPAPPTVDAALQTAYDTAAIYFPFTDVLVADPYGDLAGSLKLAFYIGDCGGWSSAGAAAAGATLGLAAGEAVGAAAAGAGASNAYAAGYAAGATTSGAYSLGAIYATLPAGCSPTTLAGTTYYLCGNTWFKPSYGANGVYYRVVPTP